MFTKSYHQRFISCSLRNKESILNTLNTLKQQKAGMSQYCSSGYLQSQSFLSEKTQSFLSEKMGSATFLRS